MAVSVCAVRHWSLDSKVAEGMGTNQRFAGDAADYAGRTTVSAETLRCSPRSDSEDREIEPINLGVGAEGFEAASGEFESERGRVFFDGLCEGLAYCGDVGKSDVDGQRDECGDVFPLAGAVLKLAEE